MRACVHCGTIVPKGETPCISAQVAVTSCAWLAKADRERLRVQLELPTDREVIRKELLACIEGQGGTAEHIEADNYEVSGYLSLDAIAAAISVALQTTPHNVCPVGD